jgi:hypothetical protein
MSSIPPQLPPSIPPVVPYASPAGSMPTAGVYRQGKILVAYKGATLPTNCVKCNAPADKSPKSRKFTWHHPAYYCLLFLGVLPYAIVALATQKSGEVYITVCKAHRRRRLLTILLAWVGVFFGIVLAIVGGNYNQGIVIGLGILISLASAVCGVIFSRHLVPSRIDDHYIFLKGAGDEFLDGLPGVANQL